MMEKGVYRMNGSHSNVVRLKAAFLESKSLSIRRSIHSLNS